jgi:hypothetical protein
LCENLNAEIASNTINSVVDAVGYLTWTFFARRVKANPAHYGANSDSDEDVEDFFLATIMEALRHLKKSGCIDFTEDEGSEIRPLRLGLSCANYYLTYQTPKQMQLGVREARKIVTGCLEESATNLPVMPTDLKVFYPLTRPTRVDEVTAAWLLYVLCSTHEFDEHPVRHNEENLNEELSSRLMWGPNTAGMLSGNARYHGIEVFQDPHTKCFLLIQAHLAHAKLPISDFVSDTKSVVENVPRLLGAMEFIAGEDSNAAGSFELRTQFSRTRQLLETRSLPNADPLLQLPGITIKLLSSMRPKPTLLELLNTPRTNVSQLLSRSTRTPKTNFEATADALFSIFPLIELGHCTVENVDKGGNNMGKLKFALNIQRDQIRQGSQNPKELSGSLLLGSYQQKMFLGEASFRVSKFGKWTVEKEIEFNWQVANSDGGAGGGKLILRIVFDEVKGIDAEAIIPLK